MLYTLLEKNICMEGEFIPLTEVVDVTEEYYEELDNLKSNIEDKDIPSWLLIPKRSSGEHATDAAWLGVVMASCSGGDGVIDTRIAIDVEDRAVPKSNVGSVPDGLLDNINRAIDDIDRKIDICIARVEYDVDELELKDVNLLLKIDEKKEAEEEEDAEE